GYFQECPKALIFGEAVVVAVINLLHDHRDFESSESDIENHAGDIAAGRAGVALNELSAREAAGTVRRTPANFLDFFRVLRPDPISERRAQIGEWVADGAHLPIENANNFRDVGWIEHYVVEFIVIVDQRSFASGRKIFYQP